MSLLYEALLSFVGLLLVVHNHVAMALHPLCSLSFSPKHLDPVCK